MSEIVQVQTAPCPRCGKESVVQMTREQYERLIARLENVQQIFPDWTPAQRELLLTGYHDECYDLDVPPDE